MSIYSPNSAELNYSSVIFNFNLNFFFHSKIMTTIQY